MPHQLRHDGLNPITPSLEEIRSKGSGEGLTKGQEVACLLAGGWHLQKVEHQVTLAWI